MWASSKLEKPRDGFSPTVSKNKNKNKTLINIDFNSDPNAGYPVHLAGLSYT